MENEEFLKKAEQIFKLVDGMSYTEWCRITHILERKYSSQKGKIKFTEGHDEYLKDLKTCFFL